jgi:hypothetical protein
VEVKEMTRIRWRGLVFPTTLVLAAAGSVAGAFAFWAGAGGGAGTAGTGTTQPVQLTPASSATLLPGGQATVSLTVANPNPGSVRIGSLSLDTSQGSVGFAVDAPHASCVLSVLSFATQTNGGAGWTIAAAGSSTVTLPNALSMGPAAADACQGASITVHLKASP